MLKTNYRIQYILAVIIFCFGCNSNYRVEPKFHGEKSKLSAELFEKLDYNVKSFGENLPDDWRKSQFQTVWKRGYFVKRRTSVKESANTFPRYDVVEEVYETEELAANRVKKIKDRPPEFINEEYWIVTGFQHQKNVYFIQTDSVMFSYYMDDFAGKLAKEISKP